jgi:hypothetical protein
MNIRSIYFTAMTILALCTGASAEERSQRLIAQSGGATIGPAPHPACEMNESREWKLTPVCGTNEAGFIAAEYRCWDFYDTVSKACKRTCTWTGKCDEH